ncbi:nucleoid-associated protein [Candidatus Clostridium stratigraminis]|uniref:Nucleoid-associated protein n=1 Tax=Candidatus Clostridium stratigraminis TaxID=3381661 RepID=A0ABW8T313_9CLOT
MDKIRDIAINEAVLHVLDNNSDEPILNNYMMELNEEVYRFILSHLERVLKDDSLKYAFFKSKNGTVKEFSQEYLNGRIDLNAASKEIVSSLFEIMKVNSNISSCDLLVVSFSTEYGPMLGILKIDYIKQYTHKIEFVDDSVGVFITRIATGLPDKKKVQKAAFIKPIRNGQDYDLLVLDKGTVKESEEYGANYFVENFLGCNIINNDRDKTRAFMDLVELWTRSNLKGEALRAEKIRTSVKEILRDNDEIDIYELTEDLFTPYEPEAKKAFIAYMQEYDLEKFEIDKEYLEKKLSKVKIKVSSDIDLNITEEAYKDINKFEIRDNGDGSIHMIIKNIENYVEK